jgi:hypothetical protein
MDNRAVLAGIGLGAALAYIFDPDRGARRRALVRDKAIRGARLTRDGLDATMCDVTNRARGIAAATRARMSDEPVDDDTLTERVRAKIGRACSHPRAIDVFAVNGDVTLRGPILAHEMSGVLAAANAVRGVSSVSSELEPHDSAEGIPSLQGGGRIAGPSFDLLQRNWAPATQALVGIGAIAAALAGRRAFAR